jgi:tyrosine aminotransferase
VAFSDVSVTCGCSHALLQAMDVLCDSGDSVLIPSPVREIALLFFASFFFFFVFFFFFLFFFGFVQGFSLYRTLADYLGVESRLYNLDPKNNWEVDLVHLESLITSSTKALLVNNPSNPCGSNYSKQHLLEIVKVAEKHNLIIISDEVYAHMAFEGTMQSQYFALILSAVAVYSSGNCGRKFPIQISSQFANGFFPIFFRRRVFLYADSQ